MTRRWSRRCGPVSVSSTPPASGAPAASLNRRSSRPVRDLRKERLPSAEAISRGEQQSVAVTQSEQFLVGSGTETFLANYIAALSLNES